MTNCCAQIRRARPLLGTFVEISLSGADEARLHGAADRAFREIGRIERLMNVHAADSEVSRLNREGARADTAVSKDTWQVLRLACQVAEATGGAFDIASPVPVRHEAPGAGYTSIALPADGRVRFTRPLRIDLGGIAKGYAVDRAVTLLEAEGLNGCVNAGGDLRGFGGCALTVAVRDPRSPDMTGAVVSVRDFALATSATYTAGGLSVAGRVIDPRGRAAAPGARSATVRAARCALADALAKAVLLLGDAAASALSSFGARAFLLDASGGRPVGKVS